ncbi:MAG: zinc-binding dehydrogenase [Candidatus Dormibacteraeota bacterium]|uniref:Zinc-binding dehydrogenase n=1 Tax=Candidatus Amunia macphersoniae TaxID=3127014 RepID=A0A934NFA6_9BACT|nr:zinc-binding dehydrogenase [Candidatus Dormibacteraeota bacterium]
MLAVRAVRYGGDDPLANLEVSEIADPTPRAGEVLLAVDAASLNHHDLWTLRGVGSRPLSEPQVLGCDAAGTVLAYGDGDVAEGCPAIGARVVVHSVLSCGHCTACRCGDELHCPRVGLLSEPPYPGTLAELLVVPSRNLIPLPDGLDMITAACLPTAYLTAYRMLVVRGGLRAGMRVLVHGATGGVASAAILIGRAAGLTVYATSRDEAKRAAAVELGATAAFATDRDAVKQVIAATGGGVDVVLDTVGEATWDFSLRVLRAGGTVVVSGATTGPNPPAQLNRIFWRQLTIAGSSMGTRDELARLVELCAAGRLQPWVDSVRPLGKAADAMRALIAGDRRGKLVLTPAA